MYRSLGLLFFGSALLLGVGARMACAATENVTIADFSFSPSSLTVDVGDTVMWMNNGPSVHTSTSDNGVWDSGNIPVGQSFPFTFNTAGTFSYHCTPHPFMTASVTVRAKGGGGGGGGGASDVSGNWSGKMRAKVFSQTTGTKTRTENDDTTAVFTQSGTNLTATLTMSVGGNQGPFSLNGLIGNGNYWLAGFTSNGNVTVTLSGHVNGKKGTSMKGIGIIYNSTSADELIFTLKKK